MVIPFIISITMEINFSSKVYSKSLLKVESSKGLVVYSLESVVIPFIINITMEINFSSKVYSKSLLKVESSKDW